MFRRHEWALVAAPAFPAILGIFYGLVIYLMVPWSRPLASVFVMGGLASVLCVLVAVFAFYVRQNKRWAVAVGTLFVVIPYAYALFLALYVGLWSLWEGISAFHGIGPVLASAFWTITGSRMLFALGIISRADRRWSGVLEDGVAEQIVPTEQGSEDRGGDAAL